MGFFVGSSPQERHFGTTQSELLMQRFERSEKAHLYLKILIRFDWHLYINNLTHTN